MKKLFCLFSVAVAGVISASALTPAPAKHVTRIMPKDMVPQTTTQISKIEDAATIEARKKGKRQVGIEDYFGYWQWSGHNWLSGVVLPNEGVMSIQQDETDPSKVLVRGFDSMAEMNGYALQGYIGDDGALYIPKQMDSAPDDVNGECYFTPYTVADVPDEPGYVMLTETDKDFWMVLGTTQDGELVLTSRVAQPDDVTDEEWPNYWMNAVCERAAGGYYWACGPVEGYILDFFEFNEAEWTQTGVAEYYDAWINPLLETPVPAYEVPVYQSLLNENRFLLFDPYGPDTPFGDLNESGQEGYVIFDTTNPECVLFEPYVFAIGADFFNEGAIEDYYFYNVEGYYHFVQGTELEQIESVMAGRGEDITYLDTNTRKLWIYNGLFDMLPEGTPGAGYSWIDADMSGYILLPEGYADSVETVLGEENVTPVYYNLQGVRVNTPERGQLVIVKKDNKTTKQIAR